MVLQKIVELTFKIFSEGEQLLLGIYAVSKHMYKFHQQWCIMIDCLHIERVGWQLLPT